MPFRKQVRRGTATLVFLLALTGCHKKSDQAPATASSDTNLAPIQINPGDATSAAPIPEPPQNADAKAYVDFGRSNGGRGDLQAAVQAFDTAISIDPKYAPAYYNRGYAKSLMNEPDEALSNFDKAIELNPDYRDAVYQRGCLKGQRGDIDGAIADFATTIKIDPKFGPAFYNLGHAYYFKGDDDKALEQINQALTLQPNFSLPYFIRGLVLHAQGHRTEALSDFQKSLGLHFAFASLWVWILESEQNQSGLARKDLSDAMASPEIFKPDAWPQPIGDFLLGKITSDDLLAKTKDGDPADKDSRDCEANFYIAMQKRLSGDGVGAKDFFTKAVATGSKGSEELIEASRILAEPAAQ